MRRKKKGGTIFIAVGVLLLAAAIGLVARNLYEEYRAGETAQSAAETLQGYISDGIESQTGSLPEESDVPDYVVNPEMEMPVEEVAGNNYVGILEIPALGLTLPIMEEWSYSNLQIAPCRYSGSAYTGNLVIAGHNYRTHFSRLKNLMPGDQLTFTDVKGRCFLYEVQAVETLEATAVEDMVSDEWDLTLFTCTVGGQARVTVRCMKVE